MFQIEEYWFVCNRWFAKGEDDGKIVRELLPTTEGGVPLDTGLSGRLHVFTLLQYFYPTELYYWVIILVINACITT